MRVHNKVCTQSLSSVPKHINIHLYSYVDQLALITASLLILWMLTKQISAVW